MVAEAVAGQRAGAPAAGSGSPGGAEPMQRLLRHSGVYAIGSVLNRLGVFLLLPVYTNYLSVAEYGRLELFYTVAAVAGGLLSVGLGHATLRFYFEYDDPHDRRRVVSTNLVAATAIAGFGALLLMPWRAQISRLVFGSPAEVVGLTVVLLTMVLELSTQIGLAYLRARERSVMFLAAVMTRLLVQVAINTWLVVAVGAGVDGVLVGNCAAVAAGWALVTGLTVQECGLGFEYAKARPVLRYAYPFLLSTIVALVAANIDRIFIRRLLSFEALGLFALASKFARLLEELVGLPFSRAYGAFRFSVMNQPDADLIQARASRLLFAGSLFAGLGIVLFAGDLLAVLSDESFAGAGAILPLLVLASIVRVVTYPLQTGILVRKRTQVIFRLSLTHALVYVVGGYLAIRLFGLQGACLAMAFAALTTAWLTDRAAQRYLPVQYEWHRWALLALLAAATYLLSLPAALLPVPLAVPLKALLLAGFVAAAARSSAFDEEERSLARAWLAGLLHRRRAAAAGAGGGSL